MNPNRQIYFYDLLLAEMEAVKHDDNFDKLFEEVFEKQTKGCITAEDYVREH
jgi:hypothetical protein